MIDVIIVGDCIETLRSIQSQSVQCVVTSPPYYGLRDYGTASWKGGDPECNHNPQQADGGDRADRSLPLGRGGLYKDVCRKCGAVRVDDQIGLEATPELYVSRLVEVFREVRRVLKDDGTLWLNLGDSYGGSGKGPDDKQPGERDYTSPPYKGNGIKSKDLMGIPWMVAFALRADGWYLRQDIIWHKPNPMPESVKDRPTKAHEYIFLMSKNAKYYYDADAVAEPCKYAGDDRGSRTDSRRGTKINSMSGKTGKTKNKRSVWTVTTKPYKGAHFATFPPDLIEPCILAGSRIGDVVLDPFVGSGTTCAVAKKHGRHFIGLELSENYAALARQRIGEVVQNPENFGKF